MIPVDAVRVATLGAAEDGSPVALWDVSHLLPRHREKRYAIRQLEELRRIYVHHSGALRPGDPFDHLVGSARYVIRKRGWAGFAYHFWVPHPEDRDPYDARIVYLGNQLEVRTFHAGPHPNDTGAAVCLQGNTSRHGMSEGQRQILPVLLRWLGRELGINPTPLGHFQADPGTGHPKASCPGAEASAWILGWQAARRPV